MSDFLQINQNGQFPLEAVRFVFNQEHFKSWSAITFQVLSYMVYGIDMPLHIEQHLICRLLLGFTCTLSCPLGLVLAGIKLILFTVASMGLFRICDEQSFDKTGMYALLLSSAYQSQNLFFSLHHSHSEVAGDGQKVGRGHRWDTGDLTWPDHRMSWSVLRDGGRRGTRKMFQVMAFVFSSNFYTMEPCFLEMAVHLENGEWIPCFVLLVCAALAFPTKLFLSQCICFLAFFSPWSHWWESE